MNNKLERLVILLLFLTESRTGKFVKNLAIRLEEYMVLVVSASCPHGAGSARAMFEGELLCSAPLLRVTALRVTELSVCFHTGTGPRCGKV